MKAILNQTPTNKGNASYIINMIRTHGIERKQFGSRLEQTGAITTMLMTQLAVPYRRKDIKHQATGQFPGNWFGLEEVGFEILDNDMFTFRFTYRMDDDLCAVLRVPMATTCQVTEVDGNAVTLDIPGFDHSMDKLAEIERDLTNSMSLFLLRA